MKPYRLAFLGTPEFAACLLDALVSDPRFEVVCAITQPDRPAGRGQQLEASPVKRLVLKNNIPVFQPASLKKIHLKESSIVHENMHQGKCDLHFDDQLTTEDENLIALVDYLNSTTIDMMITVAYGNIIPSALLSYYSRPMINVHPSLLPRWRGAAPLQYAIFAGDTETGVCLMQVEEGLDTGPVFCSEKIAIQASDNLGTLSQKASIVSKRLVIDNLERIINGDLLALPQDPSLATYAHKWEKSDCLIDWSAHASTIDRQIRASCPIPGARTYCETEILKIYSANEINLSESSYFGLAPEVVSPGTVLAKGDNIIVACGYASFLSILELQFPGRKRMHSSAALRGEGKKLYRITKLHSKTE